MSFRISPATKYANRHPKQSGSSTNSALLSDEDYKLFGMDNQASSAKKPEASKKGHAIRTTTSAQADFY